MSEKTTDSAEHSHGEHAQVGHVVPFRISSTANVQGPRGPILSPTFGERILSDAAGAGQSARGRRAANRVNSSVDAISFPIPEMNHKDNLVSDSTRLM